ncbi:hypothetical protein V6N13_019303 [Hibiscus sabdariffa]
MEFTARLGLHSQTTRLVDSASWCDRVRARRGSHPLRRPFPGDLGPRTGHVAAIRTLHRTIQSVGATGGVYKGQGRSQRELMTRAY